jgi:hypothetical protein
MQWGPSLVPEGKRGCAPRSIKGSISRDWDSRLIEVLIIPPPIKSLQSRMAFGRGAYSSLPLDNTSYHSESAVLKEGAVETLGLKESNAERWWERSRAEGWRSGVLFCASSATLVFVFNLVLTIWAVANHGWGGKEGRQILYEGSCDTSGRLNTGLHLLINALSTILLSASNYSMQTLSAPTRKDTDKAHAEERWLDIGLLSVRNLRSVSKSRAILWCVLGVTSLPLHLL